MSFDEIITKSILQIRNQCHFFGALMLFAKILPSEKIATAATNGKQIVVNKDFLNSLNSSEQNALLLHEVLHMALLHCIRIGSRDREIFRLVASEFQTGSFLTQFEIVLSGVQMTLPFVSSFGPQNIWDFTKDSFNFLKLVCGAVQKGEKPRYEFNNDGDVKVHVGDTHHHYHGSVI